MNELRALPARPTTATRATRRSSPARRIPASPPSSPAPACRWATTTCACSRRRNFLGAVRDGEQREPGAGGDASPPRACSPRSSARRDQRRAGRRRDERARRQRAAQLRRLRDDGGHRLPGARPRARARGDRRRRLRRAPTSARPATSARATCSRERLAANGLELVGGFVPIALQRARALGRGRRRPAPHARPVRRRRRGRRPPGAVRRRRPGADRQPRPRRRGRLAAARRRALAHARRRRRARGRRRARARLRAGLPPPHVDLRRGRPGDRALPRGHRRRAAARQRPPRGRRRRPGRRRCATGASGSARSTSRTCGSDVLAERQGRARRHADRLAARPVLRARARATSTSTASARRSDERGYDGWVVVEQDRVLEDDAAFARRRRPSRSRNRDWLREHAGW